MNDAWRPRARRTPRRVLRSAQRVADRLRVLGPRWSARDRPEDARPAAQVREGLQRMADAAATAEGRRPRAVPDLGPHVLADQVLVLARDVAATGDAVALTAADDVLAGLRVSL